jgi:hypothetical protein
MISSLSSVGQLQRKRGGGVVSTGQWVVVGAGTSNITSSDNGNIWSAVTPIYNQFQYGRGVAYGKYDSGAELWVAVGYGPPTVTSKDGKTIWSTGQLGGISTGKKVEYGKDASGNGLWVAVGQGGNAIASSSDGFDWKSAAITNINQGYDVAYGKDGNSIGLWIVVGSPSPGSGILKSSSGLTWSNVPISGVSTITSIAYSDTGSGSGTKLWVIGRWNQLFLTSPDGTNWTPIQADASGGIIRVNGISYGKDGNGQGLWVAVGSGSKIVKSSNGTNWTAASSVGSIFEGYGVSYGNGIWIVVGDATVATSPDGNIWTDVPAGNRGGITYGYGVAFKPP